MITELTDEQTRLIDVYKDKWMGVGLSVKDLPDEKVNEIIDGLYQVLDRKEPVKMILDSPIQCCIAYTILDNKEEILSNTVKKIVSEVQKEKN